ncbi:DUF5605 domain-containing protein [Nonomuraea rosea]|uniref:DUF5605 domain-containing protein n=1 Tax=Nonomuraea rosea TaxID=638574 RepID=A0ABP7A7X2_9ACTN
MSPPIWPASVERWAMHELELAGPDEGNPFKDVQLTACYQFRNRIVEVDGFYDGGGVYRVRFMPDKAGLWRFVTVSNAAELDGFTGELNVTEASRSNHGPVRAHRTNFLYADGTRFMPFGTTCYHWTHDLDEEREQATLNTLQESPFNKLRMCVLPIRKVNPPLVPFAGSDPDGLDLDRFNPSFFQHFERRVSDLRDIGVEADVILFHPYDRGYRGLEDMGRERDHAYLRYVIARLGAYRNVWWSLANEYNFNRSKTIEDWDDLFRFVKRIDPYEHLLSIHNGNRMYERGNLYDFTKPWISHQSIQHWDMASTTEWLNKYSKPAVLDEISYEGDAARRWANISGQELVHRFWECATRGGYPGHSETFVGQGDRPWLHKGGTLHGESPSRIGFLRMIMESVTDMQELRYLGRRQSATVSLDLPPGSHRVEVIDTWNMTITPIDEALEGHAEIKLPRRPYLALRISKFGT